MHTEQPPAHGAANVWSARTGAGTAPLLERLGSSIQEDAHFLVYDVMASIAHVEGLVRSGLLAQEDARLLCAALAGLARDHADGTWTLDAGLEDVHMNIEARVTASLPDIGPRLHTGRSRNDQVAACLVLWARERMADLGHGLASLADRLATRAVQHATTPWVARTHGQPAQPATLGFLLAAHAFRCLDAAEHCLATFDRIGESPLGSGAVAGTTLPLDPAYTAGLLGLRAPRNALLATGTRDVALAVAQSTSTTGTFAAGLAEDLFQLSSRGCVRFGAGLSTGSSLMPHKQNPDAVELARALARALPGHEQRLRAITQHGLGYVRDFQITKPIVVAAATEALLVVDTLLACLDAAAFDEAALTRELQTPGVGATDAAEAMVRMGVPFRHAYRALASAHASPSPAEALLAAGSASSDAFPIPRAAREAAIAALQGDASARALLAGPAPGEVLRQVSMLRAAGIALDARLAQAYAATAVPRGLLETRHAGPPTDPGTTTGTGSATMPPTGPAISTATETDSASGLQEVRP